MYIVDTVSINVIMNSVEFTITNEWIENTCKTYLQHLSSSFFSIPVSTLFFLGGLILAVRAQVTPVFKMSWCLDCWQVFGLIKPLWPVMLGTEFGWPVNVWAVIAARPSFSSWTSPVCWVWPVVLCNTSWSGYDLIIGRSFRLGWLGSLDLALKPKVLLLC
jgi:hypothetical protein